MSTSKKETSPILLLLMIGIGIYLLYLIVQLLVRSFVYFGYNIFFFTDNLLHIQSLGPVVVWGVLGIFIGGTIGVGIAIKKFQLSKKLFIYPVLVLVLFFTTMGLINRPGQYTVGYDILQAPVIPTDPSAQVNTTKIFYKVVSDVTVRSGPSTGDAKLFILYKGATVEMVKRFFIDKRRIEWMKIKYNNQEGYVSLKYLKHVPVPSVQ